MGAKSLNFDPESVPHGGCLREIVRFLRDRYNSYNADTGDLRFCCVDLKLGGTRTNWQRTGTIQLYFLKENLYLVGWTIDNDPAYIKVGDDSFPQPAQAARRNPGKGFPVEHVSAAGHKLLGRQAFEDSVCELYDFLAGKKAGKNVDHKGYMLAFSLVIRMTSELARFGAHFEDFIHRWWSDDWDQRNELTKDGVSLPPFDAVINLWIKIRRKARDGTGAPEELSQNDCNAILGDGVRLR
ncbi:ribosome-inactivating family protein [Nonomuraea longicatena]